MEDYLTRLTEIKTKLDFEGKKAQITAIQKESEEPSFWADHLAASKKMQELSSLQKEVEEIEMLELELAENALNEHDARKRIEALEMKTYFTGPYDHGDAVFSIHAGQGGT